ncbi:MAG: DUF4404 family protein [Planctomycetaceae bacterium]|nr:DUF4404 family protein [Planctomycetaceae bacterium]
MEREQLKSTLRDLHDKLSAEESIDDETTALLQQLADDIDRLSQKPEAAEPPKEVSLEQEKQGLLDRLLDLSEGFEESHPQLARAIGNVASALSRIGI